MQGTWYKLDTVNNTCPACSVTRDILLQVNKATARQPTCETHTENSVICNEHVNLPRFKLGLIGQSNKATQGNFGGEARNREGG